jgi:hypothetical protein
MTPLSPPSVTGTGAKLLVPGAREPPAMAHLRDELEAQGPPPQQAPTAYDTDDSESTYIVVPGTMTSPTAHRPGGSLPVAPVALPAAQSPNNSEARPWSGSQPAEKPTVWASKTEPAAPKPPVSTLALDSMFNTRHIGPADCGVPEAPSPRHRREMKLPVHVTKGSLQVPPPTSSAHAHALPPLATCPLAAHVLSVLPQTPFQHVMGSPHSIASHRIASHSSIRATHCYYAILCYARLAAQLRGGARAVTAIA